MAEQAIKELSGRIGKYDIIKPLGKGAMGIVYLAEDSMLKRQVALKVMVSNIADDPELKARFEREAQAVARMSHPNVVNVFDLGYHTDGSPYMAMELLKGDDLQKIMRQTPLALEKKVETIVQVLVGLAHAHQAGIVHRDIKPANIFMGTDGSVKIMDFGVARLSSANMTGTGAIVGTADYMSPEQVKGARVDGRSDLFSVGSMMFELLVGKRPFHAENLMAIFFKITHDEPNWELLPKQPEYQALVPVLQKALTKDLNHRYANAEQYAIALRDYLAKHSPSASIAGRALEGLVDLKAPTSTPAPLEDLLDDPDGTINVTQGQSATRVGAAPTVVGSGPVSGTRVGATKVLPQQKAAPRPAPPPPPPPKSNAGLIAAGFVGIAGVIGGGFWFISKQLAEKNQATTTTHNAGQLPTPGALPTTAGTQAPIVVPTAAPPPKLETPAGKAAGTIKAAQDAFSSYRYQDAITKAQQALKEDPGNHAAQNILDMSKNGQKALDLLAGARSSLNSKDYAKARQIADQARSLAPSDRQVNDLLGDIARAEQADRDAVQRADAEKATATKNAAAAAVARALDQASDAMGASKYDEAIALYNKVLSEDPANALALQGKTQANQLKAQASAAAANAAAAAAAPPAQSGRTFANGKTIRKAGGPSGAAAAGFGEAKGTEIKSGSQAADLPGSITFEIQPKNPKPGDEYKVVVKFTNDGSAPIDIKGLTVGVFYNGKGVRAPQSALVSSVAPGDTAVIYTMSDGWRDATAEWSYFARVTGAKGETYENTVTWK